MSGNYSVAFATLLLLRLRSVFRLSFVVLLFVCVFCVSFVVKNVRAILFCVDFHNERVWLVRAKKNQRLSSFAYVRWYRIRTKKYGNGEDTCTFVCSWISCHFSLRTVCPLGVSKFFTTFFRFVEKTRQRHDTQT